MDKCKGRFTCLSDWTIGKKESWAGWQHSPCLQTFGNIQHSLTLLVEVIANRNDTIMDGCFKDADLGAQVLTPPHQGLFGTEQAFAGRRRLAPFMNLESNGWPWVPPGDRHNMPKLRPNTLSNWMTLGLHQAVIVKSIKPFVYHTTLGQHYDPHTRICPTPFDIIRWSRKPWRSATCSPHCPECLNLHIYFSRAKPKAGGSADATVSPKPE